MKKLLFLVLLCSTVALSQTQVFDQNASNKFIHYKTNVALTNIFTVPTYLVGIVINTHVTNDVMTVRAGTDTVAHIVLGATALTYPVFVPLSTNVDTLSFSKSSTSDVTIIYQTRRNQ